MYALLCYSSKVAEAAPKFGLSAVDAAKDIASYFTGQTAKAAQPRVATSVHHQCVSPAAISAISHDFKALMLPCFAVCASYFRSVRNSAYVVLELPDLSVCTFWMFCEKRL